MIPSGHVLNHRDDAARENEQQRNDADDPNDVQSDENVWRSILVGLVSEKLNIPFLPLTCTRTGGDHCHDFIIPLDG